ncbi:membrane protein [Lactobacillus bombicola]|uniref:Membrane protein n=1 Tax=Lactobacillus bombicola TaxID=1505723 RepID=A0A1I1SI56_9LACO|nr:MULTISPECIES: YihY/virulence factor BrkB family protein [Lactobacillus]MCO6527758.1 YihY/virulence factor BrkB family protein [Lactobacillus sp.]RHW49019.1 YihY/virulence factor BrkB family protein [Lactobacillus bombicola]RHW54297.1 YihY/virulence factor BrkB family protein [Lactobacillus bombicola]RMC42129.1 YihY/virulence factor BrkB family protein [Lactobacillus sp. ESL0233]SFD44338.1 membrane protein [Lactobacillus bombicola]
MGKKVATISQRLALYYKTISLKFTQGEVLTSAISMAYYVLFSIFPLIIIIGNILPLLHIDTAPIASYLKLIFPDRIAGFIMPIINSLLKNNSTGYISFGIILALWSVSSLVNAIRIGMNRIYGVRKVELQQNWPIAVWTRSITIILTNLMIISFSLLSLTFIFGQQILEFLRPIFAISVGELEKIFNFRYPVVIITMISSLYYLNYFLPNIKLKKRVIWPGVFTTLLGWLSLSWLFSYYLHHFHISWENYGIIGTFIIFMLWLNLCSILFLIGTCVNAAIVSLNYGEVQYSVGHLAEYIQKKRHH